MIVLFLQHFLVAAQPGVDLAHGLHLAFFQIFQHFAKDLGQRQRIVHRTVVVEGLNFQVLVHGVQLVVAQARIQHLCHGQRVDIGVGKAEACTGRAVVQHFHIKAVAVVRHQNAAAAPLVKLLQRLLGRGGIGHHGIVDARKLHDFGRNGNAGIHKGGKAIRDLAVFHHHRTNFGEAVMLKIQAGGFHIKHHEPAVHGFIVLAVNHGHHIVYKIGFAAVDHLKIGVFFMNAVGGSHGLGVALTHAVVGNGNGAVTHAVCQLHNAVGITKAVHAGKLGVQVQLHALFGRVVTPGGALHHQHIIGIHHIIVLVFIIGAAAAHHQRGAGLEPFPLAGLVGIIVIAAAHFQIDRAMVVGDGNHIAFAEVALGFGGKHIAPDHHLAIVGPQLGQRGKLGRAEHFAMEHLGGGVLQGKAGHLDGRALLFLGGKGHCGHLFLNVLLPLVLVHFSAVLQLNSRAGSRAL